MTEAQFKDLGRFVSYAEKHFSLPLLAGCFADGRAEPEVPSRAVGLSLLLGEVIQTPGLSQLEEETKLPQWQRWVGYSERISHDTFGYASNRMNPEQLRRAGLFINRRLKRGKAFEASKMHGLLVVSLDANEQFCSDHRCCEDCLTREVTCKDAEGKEFKKTQYYHKQVYAQLSGPRLSVILDLEPMRPGEEECAAALRLLRRMRQKYGPRFFDLVVAGELDPYAGAAIRDFGHLRWKIENNAFGELTQHWHLTHCSHHQPVAVLALLWIKIISFTLFHAFAILHGKLFRLGKVTLQELRRRIYRSLLCGWPIRCFSG
jgi:hypothetical protein